MSAKTYFESNEPDVTALDVVIYEDDSVPDLVSDCGGIRVVEHHVDMLELLDLVRRCEALLTKQRWIPGPNVPESALLRDCRAAIHKVEAA
jgi:hypothetical protein